MNKRSLMAFSFGIFFSVSLIGFYYFRFEDKPQTITQKEAIQLLKEKNYVVLTKSEYTELTNKQTESKQKTEEKTTEKKTTTKEKVNKEEASEKEKITYSLEITSGMTSEEIANILENHGIIDNGNDLSVYLDENGYSTKIQLGIFNLSNGMSLDQIARIITKS